jgi:hypothetical protein
MAGDKKKPAKMGHTKDTQDTGRKRTIPCSCGSRMDWCRVEGKMKYFCGACGLVCSA